VAKTIQRKIWVSIAALVCTLGVFLVYAPDHAQADTLLGYSGYPGPSALTDSFYNPAAGCSYTWSTVAVATNPPKVWARSNYTNGQWVSYRYRVFELNSYHNQSWTRIGTSAQKYALAYPNQRASLPGVSHNWYKEYTGANNVYHKVLIDIYWYNSSGAVSGTTTRQVDYYLNGNVYRANSCFYH